MSGCHLSMESWWQYLFPTTVCNNLHRVLPTQDTHLSLWCPEFLLGSIAYVACLSVFQSLAPPRGWATTLSLLSLWKLANEAQCKAPTMLDLPQTKTSRQRHSYQDIPGPCCSSPSRTKSRAKSRPPFGVRLILHCTPICI